MAQALSTVQELIGKLEGIVERGRIITDPAALDGYGRDTSYGQCKRPEVAVKVQTTEEVCRIVKLANEHCIPVTPKSSATGFYGAAIPEQGGIVIDMSAMNNVLRIDTRNRWAMFQAGVTYGQLQDALAAVGYRAINPLLPHKDKSVITSLLEREPRLIPKHHLDETIFTMEMVLPNGELFHTGSMSISPMAPEKIPEELPCDLCNFHGPGLDWYRLVPGSLGTYGIVTVMNAKIAPLPRQQKTVFIGFNSLQECVEPLYKILRKLIGDECCLLNSRSLATIIAEDPADIERVSGLLPPYTVMLNLAAGEWYPEKKLAYLEHALHELARTYMFRPMDTISNVHIPMEIIERCLYRPWDNGLYWKARAKGASKEVFFLTQLQRAPEFLHVIQEVASAHNYAHSDIGLYIQPKQNGRAFHMEASFAFDPASPAEKERAEKLHLSVSRELIAKGAFFYRIYGPWADMVYSRTGALHQTLKRIKKTLDPNAVLNPGKLGF